MVRLDPSLSNRLTKNQGLFVPASLKKKPASTFALAFAVYRAGRFRQLSLYLFLLLAADRVGISFYGYCRIQPRESKTKKAAEHAG